MAMEGPRTCQLEPLKVKPWLLFFRCAVLKFLEKIFMQETLLR
ncbi:hypothetical protein BIW11_03657 [Tropilaelaps mercedesae]|uniref:Uncharacterized protein n=1 Tax=Tropilaelaps mercedesae TaxID=418985 RepID=A0A1V9XHT7_9ACAR|nr:hypothetical protein BIW11_03657 [Tropilaelaps mercedesae]